MYEVKKLKYKYKKNGELILNDLNFSVKKGEIFGLLGPSGAGKSTLQNILIKLLSDYEGNILYNGKELSTIGKKYYNDIGVCFELPVVVETLSCLDNIKFIANFYNDTANIEVLLKKVGLLEHKDKLVKDFSKGMKMRLNFIRALLNNPKVLFLDEPTNGLDPINAQIIKNIVQDFKLEGGTVIITTHLMKDVEEICDRVAFVKSGTIVGIDSPSNFKKKYGNKTITVEYEKEKKIYDMKNLKKEDEFFDILKNNDVDKINTNEIQMDEIFKIIIGDGNE